jgi:WD40 repeat protein
VNGVAFSPDGKILAVACGKGPVYLWRAISQSRSLPALGASNSPGLTSIAFSPQGAMLAAGSINGRIYLWNLASRKLAANLMVARGTGGVSDVAFGSALALPAIYC